MLEVLHRLGVKPRFVVWELTLQCDMRCLHCGSFAGAPRPDELSREQLLDIAAQLADMGAERLTLSGGEPTLHPHWDEIGCALTSRGVKTNIITNGWSWTPEHTRKAKAAGLNNAGFSLDGPEHAHDTVRGKPGSYQRVVAAIKDCISQGFPTSVVSHINRLNVNELESFRDTLQELGVRSWQVQVGTPMGNMTVHRDLIIDPKELLDIVPRIAAMKQSSKLPTVHAADDLGYYGKYEQILRGGGAKISFWIGCRAGFQVIGIESNGNIKGCLSLPSARQKVGDFVEGNLRDQKLKVIWEKEGAFDFNRGYDVSKLEGFCATCRFKDICRGGCSCAAFGFSGNRFDNPLCFYRQAVENKRWDLLDDDEPGAQGEAAATTEAANSDDDPACMPMG